jgi:hypothetical protein
MISGRSHVVGSSHSAIDGAVAAAKTALRESQVPLSLRFEDGTLVVQVGDAPAGAGRGDHIDPPGENANRTVTYRNIVRSLKTIVHAPLGRGACPPPALTRRLDRLQERMRQNRV